MSMIETPWKEFREGGQRYRMKVKYGLDYNFANRHNQDPYFSITGSIERLAGRWREDSGGMLHDEISKHFPNLRPLLKWHLFGTQGPLHYLANGKYWWELYSGTSKYAQSPGDHDPKQAFMSTVVADEHELPPKGTPWPEVKAWLEERLPHLLEEFDDVMAEIGVLEAR